MRCFVAVNVSDPVRRLLGPVLAELRKSDADVRWEPEENLHVTLKFLGEIGAGPAEKLRGLLAVEASRRPGFPLEFTGLGSFPEGGEPRVLWVGCRGDAGKLCGLAAAIESAAEQVGVPREARSFSPHLTIGRVKSSRNLEPLRQALAGRKEVLLGSQEVGSFDLVESTLTPRGSVYRTAGTFALSTSG